MTTKTRKRTKKASRQAVTTRTLPDEELTEEQLYHRNYYRNNKQSRSEAHKKRWAEDEEYRQREIQRLRDRRADARRQVAADRFSERVQEKRDAAKPTRRPKLVEIEGERIYVYGTGTLARELGREDATVRSWLSQGVLPGASIWIGRRAHFTPAFCAAARAACVRLLEHDGRGNLDILRDLIRSEFVNGDISYVPKGSSERARFPRE